jgi:hypothetical protein
MTFSFLGEYRVDGRVQCERPPRASSRWPNGLDLLLERTDLSPEASDLRAIDSVLLSIRFDLSSIDSDLSAVDPFGDRRRARVELKRCRHG